MSEKLNKGFDIPKEELEERIGFSTQLPDGINVVPLRQIRRTQSVVVMSNEEMNSFLRGVPLISAKDIFPYKTADISKHTSGANGLCVAQKFIQRSKLLSLLEGLNPLYDGFCFPGLAHRQAHYVIGFDREDDMVAGVYFPPLLEIVGIQALLIDGNHRQSLCGSVGTPIETVIIKGSSVDPPYKGVPWKHQKFVDEKPFHLSERYLDFNPSLLKDFDYVGIDG